MPKDTFNNLPEEKQQRIINVGIKEFAENPYDVASISKIVRQAGIAKGSFYQYFEDKNAFYQHLIALALDEKLRLVKDLPAPKNNTDLFGYLRWQFLTEVYFEIRHPYLSQISYRAFVERRHSEDMSEELQRRGTTQFFKQLVTQGALHGSIAPWVDADVAAFIIEILFYQFGKYFVERLVLTEEDFVDQSIFYDEEAQHLINNLMDILVAGMETHPDIRKDFIETPIKKF
jgi:AcrR family transcriptional regulator